VRQGDVAAGEQARAQDRQRRVLGAGHRDFSVQALAADNLEFIHAQPPYSSGVRVFIDSAWISSRMRSPSAAYTSWWRWIGRLPANAGDTIRAEKWRPSPSTCKWVHCRPFSM